jgi:hypothetical protein
MKGLHRDRNRRKASKPKPVSDASKATQLAVIPAPKLGTTCPGSTTAFYGHHEAFSLTGKDSHLQSLLEYCMSNAKLSPLPPLTPHADLHAVPSSWYPLGDYLTYNPVNDEWFRVVMTDEIMLRGAAYAAASRLALTRGEKDSPEQGILLQQVYQHLKRRIQEHDIPLDATIGALSCLASVEVCSDIPVIGRSKWLTYSNRQVKATTIPGRFT